jgi:uncharacterized protein
MLLGILSDTHNRSDRTARAIKLLTEAGVEALIHCGDICEPGILSLLVGTPTWFVLGNNDYEPELQSAAKLLPEMTYVGKGGILTLAKKKLAVTHGHLHRVTKELLSQQPDYLFSGHTHVAAHEIIRGVTCINPGALHRAAEYSVAVLDLVTGDVKHLPVPA